MNRRDWRIVMIAAAIIFIGALVLTWGVTWSNQP